LSGHVVAMGGHPGGPLVEFVLGLTHKERPRVLIVPTAQGDDPWAVVRSYELFPPTICQPSHLRLFGVPEAGWREKVASQDVVWVGGGNTANLLAVWRAQGFDAAIRSAWERGAVLCGSSAGAICWFEASVTDSFRAELDGMCDGLGLLPGSCCPHYDGEALRRPRYHELVAAGFPAGFGIDDGAALHFEGTGLVEAVTAREGATAYRVELRDGDVAEVPLPARRLPGG
jgi:dipeptidase E